LLYLFSRPACGWRGVFFQGEIAGISHNFMQLLTSRAYYGYYNPL
jgi:hypothetical protein